jgi:hypothetical protein
MWKILWRSVHHACVIIFLEGLSRPGLVDAPGRRNNVLALECQVSELIMTIGSYLLFQINRNDLTLRGKLVQLLTEGPSPNPRWLVKFDGQPQKDEKMHERSFGKVLVSYDDEEPSSSSPISAVQRKPAKPQGSGGLQGSGGMSSATTKPTTKKLAAKKPATSQRRESPTQRRLCSLNKARMLLDPMTL